MKNIISKLIFKIVGLIFILLFNTPELKAQENKPIIKDYHIWTSIGASYKINKLKFELEQAARLDDTISTVYRNFTQLSVAYKLSKWATVSTGFRNTYDVDGYRRIFGAVKLNENIKKFDFSLRTKFEHTFEFSDSEQDNSRLRNSLKVEYTKYDLRPIIFAEIFNPLGVGSKLDAINRFRYGVKFAYKYNKHVELDLGIFHNDNYKKKKTNRDLVFKFGANYKL